MRIVFFILCEKPFSPYVGRQPRPDILVINVKFNKRTTKSTEYHVDTQATIVSFIDNFRSTGSN